MVAGVLSQGRSHLQGRRNPFVAQEGIPFLLASIVSIWFTYRYVDLVWFGLAIFVFILLFLIFRDPRRRVPAVPLGVISPVDGEVASVEVVEKGVLQGKAHIVTIDVDSLGTYTARCPVEGLIMDLGSLAEDAQADYRTNALWVRSDEGDDVVLQFSGYRFGLAPRSMVRFGERLGQGSRCAYLRLARYAEVHIPIDAKVLVSPGDRVVAGRDVLAKLRHS